MGQTLMARSPRHYAGDRSRRALAMHKNTTSPLSAQPWPGLPNPTNNSRLPRPLPVVLAAMWYPACCQRLRSRHAFPPFAFYASLPRRAVGPAGDISSKFLRPRSRSGGAKRTRAAQESAATSRMAAVEIDARLCRRDVLVEMEDVVGVVRALGLSQPIPAGPVRRL